MIETRTRLAILSLLSPLAFLLLSPNVRAQSGPPVLEFSFSNPGARSIGLGGAFAALADDATAAFANPAGLVQLARPEVSVEGRMWNYTTPFTSGGRMWGTPTGTGLDTTPDLRFDESSSTLAGVSFLSFVYPSGKWSLAFYRHQLANFEAIIATQGFFATDEQTGESFRTSDFRTSTRLEVVNYGFSGAYRLSDSLSLGLGLSYFDGKLDTRTEFYAPIVETLPEGPLGPNTYVPEARISTQKVAFDDTSWSWSGGFLWRVSRPWSLGGFYRRGPKFSGGGGVFSGPALDPPLSEGTVLEQEESPLRLPDVFGLGAAYRSEDGSITGSFEWDHVNYSVIIESFDPGIVDPDVRLNDVDEFHFGFEYVFINWTPLIALRGGIWVDPEHRIRYEGDDAVARAFFRRGEETWHYAFGFGLATKRFQLDLGFDLSNLVNTASLSAIMSF